MVTKRIAVVADSHFHEASRFDECIRLHDWIARDAIERECDLLVHSGDVFEKKSTPRERDEVADLLQDIATSMPVVLVRGNHDEIGDLPLFERLSATHEIDVVEAAHAWETAGVHVAAVAWPRKAMLDAAGVDPSEAMRAILRGLGAVASPPGMPRLFVGHVMMRGSMTSTGQPLVGVPLEIGLEDLALADCDAYALGHIHLSQAWQIGEAPVIYPGSPRRTSFGETEAKGYVVIEFEGRKASWQFVEAPATPMVLIEAAWRHHDIAGAYALDIDSKAFPSAERVRGAEVRLRCATPSDQREAARRAALELRDAMLANGAISVKVEEEVSATVRARAPEVAIAKTLPEKLSALWASRGVNVGDRRDGLLTKVAQLEEAHRG